MVTYDDIFTINAVFFINIRAARAIPVLNTEGGRQAKFNFVGVCIVFFNTGQVVVSITFFKKFIGGQWVVGLKNMCRPPPRVFNSKYVNIY